MAITTAEQESIDREHAAAVAGDMDAVYEEQILRAGKKAILDEDYVDGTPPEPLLTDLEARVDDADNSHPETLNEDIAETIGEVNEWGMLVRNDEHISVNIDEGNIAGNDENGIAVGTRGVNVVDTQGIEDLGQEAVVATLAAAGTLYTKGGPLGNWTGSMDDLSDGADGAFLAERSKQTGEKYF
jgi:hypothetical protein